MPALVFSILAWLGSLLIALIAATAQITGTEGAPSEAFFLIAAATLATFVFWLVGLIGGLAGLSRTAHDPLPSRARSLAKGAVALAGLLALVVVSLVTVEVFPQAQRTEERKPSSLP